MSSADSCPAYTGAMTAVSRINEIPDAVDGVGINLIENGILISRFDAWEFLEFHEQITPVLRLKERVS